MTRISLGDSPLVLSRSIFPLPLLFLFPTDAISIYIYMYSKRMAKLRLP